MKMDKQQLEFLKTILSGNTHISIKQRNTQLRVLSTLINEDVVTLDNLSKIEDSRKQFITEILEITGYNEYI